MAVLGGLRAAGSSAVSGRAVGDSLGGVNGESWSFGNGGAMRSPVVGLFFYPRRDRVGTAARLAAEVTHAHPLGIEGAELIAEATAAALDGVDGRAFFERAACSASSPEYSSRFELARSWLDAGKPITPKEVRAKLGMGIIAPESCVTALYLAARFVDQPFEALLAFAAAAGGDVDTVGAMAGALWGARNGLARLPLRACANVEDAARVSEVAAQLYARSHALG